MKVERSGRVNDMVGGSTCYLLEERSRAGVKMLQGGVRGAKQEDARHLTLAQRFQTSKNETRNASFSLGPEYGSIRYILNEDKKEGHRTDWKSKAVDITIKY